MLTNLDEYKNYIVIYSNEPIEIDLPKAKTGTFMEIKGQVTVCHPVQTKLEWDENGKVVSNV